MSTQRAEQKKKTRGLILKTALKQFKKNGYEKTTMRSIAIDIGISPGTIFVHFENKHELLVSILHDKIEKMLIEAFEELDRSSPLKEQLLFLSTQAYKFYFKDPNLSRALFKEALFKQVEGEDILEKQIENYVISLFPLFEIAKKQKQIANNCDVIGVCRLYFSSYFAVLMKFLKQEKPKTEDAKKELQLSLDQIFLGIKY
jgi:AcrR family transcriptional regulator